VTTEMEVDVCEEFVATTNLYRDVKAVVSTWCRRLGMCRLHLYLLAPSQAFNNALSCARFWHDSLIKFIYRELERTV
jgi:hypothetical protein